MISNDLLTMTLFGSKSLARFSDIDQNLEILAEECAEVIQIKSKIVRFGMDDVWPARGMSNREALEQELGDVLALAEVLIVNGVLSLDGLTAAKARKIEKMGRWYR